MSRTTIKGTSIGLWMLSGLFSIAGLIVVWALKALLWVGKHVGAWMITHLRTTLGIGTITGAVLLLGWQFVVWVVGIALLTGSVWKAAHRESFDATVGAWARTWHRKWWNYRRRWENIMTRCGLTVEVGQEVHLPKLKKVSTTQYWDRLLIEPQIGQEPADFQNSEGVLRRAFEGERLRVSEVHPKRVEISVMRRDPFRYEAVPATPMPSSVDEVDYRNVPVGLDEFLCPLRVSVVGGNLAGAGTMGAGKAGVIWNILRGLAPAIGHGLVKPIFIDPKAKELRQGIALVDAGVYGTATPEMNTRGRLARDENGNEITPEEPTGDYAVTEWDTVNLLERIVKDVEAQNLRDGEAGERDFEPSVDRPLRLICIDELAPLLAYWSRGARDRIEDALGIILTQGRAAGYLVVGLIQEPTKDIFTIRDLFIRRLGLRLPTEDHTDAALTDDAVKRGAECSRIPESLPGVCFSFTEGDKTAIRGRLGHVRDEDIRELVEYVTALRSMPALPSAIGTEQAQTTDAAPAIEYVDEAQAGQVIELHGDQDEQGAA